MIILGSQSPRRREILEFFSLPFKQISSQFEEECIPFEGDPAYHAQILSQGKARSLTSQFPHAIILTADTLVFKDGKLFMKPGSEDEAFEMLSNLNGAWHSVFTALSVRKEEKEFTLYEETRVLFHRLSFEELKQYHKNFNGIDKAGGYGIQMAGSIIVKKMEGCFYNVMGMPITGLRKVLMEVGIDLWSYLS